MNKFIVYPGILLFALPAIFLFGQQGTDALFLNNTTGTLNIGMSGALTADTLFRISPAGELSVYFYFQEDDPRNGSYTGRVSTEGGSPHLVFDSLLLVGPDSLTFGMIDTMPQGYLTENVFVRGVFRPNSGGETLLIPCPSRISCNILGESYGEIMIFFDPSEYLVTFISPARVYLNGGPFFSLNGLFFPGVDYGLNALRINTFYYANFNLPFGEICEQIENGNIIVTIGGKNCIFDRGNLVNSGSCNPLSGLYTSISNACIPYIEGCNEEIIYLLSQYQNELQCKQWYGFSAYGCSTWEGISKPSGRVAIGTTGFAPNAALTVKNGILTNRMKVIPCDGSWCDYVFDPNYPLMPLDQVEAFVGENRHLPGQPSGAIFESEGSFELGELTKQHQEKIEEAYLYLIDMDKRLTQLEQELAFLKAKQAWEVK